MAKAPVLTPRADDFPRWYQDVIAKAELAENGPVRGTMVIRPYGYGLWERMQREMDTRIKAAGAQNAYFPLFIPQSYLAREAEHVEGFAPELAVVTHGGGGKELEEPVVVRPTSETIVNDYFSRWVQSYRDLPLLINQWANVVRWEMRPRVFLRTTEFLWQEGHTAHATREEARDYAARIHRDVYADFMVNVLGIDVVLGRKTPRERFAGAINTLTLEGMMGDGKALQLGTSHELGTNFARAFNTRYLSREGRQELVHQTSWGTSTRMVGGLIMSHGDDNGLRVPPRLAAVQIVVMAIKGDEAVTEARRIGDLLEAAGLRVRVDDRTDVPFGRRAVDWELKGVPVRIEIGPRDLAAGTAMLARRIPGGKEPVRVDELAALLPGVLEEDQEQLLRESRERRESRTSDTTTIPEAAEAALAGGWARIPWAVLGEEGEAALAERSVSVRCLISEDGSVPTADDTPGAIAIVSRAY
ncbi:proline--tRNA ligase [Streptomyces sp. CAU 1734]|uniref:proline--tRNA ligase n=1 Tax=Streptomyces sp. CAU 1734 TaxID=3140360 RepID=UPI003260001C